MDKPEESPKRSKESEILMQFIESFKKSYKSMEITISFEEVERKIIEQEGFCQMYCKGISFHLYHYDFLKRDLDYRRN